MSTTVAALRARLNGTGTKKFIRYSLVSIVSVVVTVSVQTVAYGVFYVPGRWSAIIASTVAAVPSYYLNRTWVWGKNGKSHLMKEVAPFWVMAAIGLAFSTWASDFADTQAHHITSSHPLRTVIVVGAAVVAFGVLWVVKYLIFNKILFAHRPEELELDPALDGRSGLPT